MHDTLGRLEEVRYPDVPGRERFVLKNVYDAATGELVRRDDATDPLAQSMLWQVDGSLAQLHRYAYVTNNPLRWVDPRGFEAQPGTVVTCGSNHEVDEDESGAERQGYETVPDALVVPESPPNGGPSNPTTPQKADGPAAEPPRAASTREPRTMRIQVDVLRAALNKLLDHATEVQGNSIEVDSDFYWFVPKEAIGIPEADPSGLTLGSLEDDWSKVAAIGVGAKEPFGYGLVWASTLLRAIGDRTP